MTNASPIGVGVLLTIMSAVLLALGIWLRRRGRVALARRLARLGDPDDRARLRRRMGFHDAA